jgi:hypothetical protein
MRLWGIKGPSIRPRCIGTVWAWTQCKSINQIGYIKRNLSYRICNKCRVRITKVSKLNRLQSRLQMLTGERCFSLFLTVHTSFPINKH